MRIRSIKPEFWRSPDISALSLEDRLLFIGLWSYVDDNGVGQDRVATICADLFADDLSRDPRETLARVTGGLARLSEAGRIVRYTVENREYLAVANWSKHQRIDKPNKARYPAPTSDDAEIRETLARPSRHPRDILAPGTGEQGNRGAGEQGNTLAQPSGSSVRRFDDFWTAYPRKVGKQKARAKYAAATKRATEEQIIDGAHRLATDPNLPEQQFIPHPTTWLERDGWEDEPLPPRPANRNQQRIDGLNQMVRDHQLPEGDDPWEIRKLNAASPSNSSALPPDTTDDPNPTPSRSKHGLQVFDGSQVLNERTGTRG